MAFHRELHEAGYGPSLAGFVGSGFSVFEDQGFRASWVLWDQDLEVRDVGV